MSGKVKQFSDYVNNKFKPSKINDEKILREMERLAALFHSTEIKKSVMDGIKAGGKIQSSLIIG